MKIIQKFRVGAIGLVCLASLLLFPLRGECQAGQAADPCESIRSEISDMTNHIWETDLTALMGVGNFMVTGNVYVLHDDAVLLIQAQGLQENLEFSAGVMQNSINAMLPEINANSKNQEDLALVNALRDQLKSVNTLLERVKNKITELKARVSKDQTAYLQNVKNIRDDRQKLAALEASLKDCVSRGRSAAPATNSNLPPAIVANSTHAPAPKSQPSTDILADWTLTTAGGCRYPGYTKPVVTHKLDGEMHLVRAGTIDPKTHNPVLSTIVGSEIDSVVESWTMNGEQVTLIVHPTSYFDDAVTNPPKDKFNGGWVSRLQFKGTFSPDGSIRGSIFHDSPTPDCTFTMTRN